MFDSTRLDSTRHGCNAIPIDLRTSCCRMVRRTDSSSLQVRLQVLQAKPPMRLNTRMNTERSANGAIELR